VNEYPIEAGRQACSPVEGPASEEPYLDVAVAVGRRQDDDLVALVPQQADMSTSVGTDPTVAGWVRADNQDFHDETQCKVASRCR